jgi:hypothetical protein
MKKRTGGGSYHQTLYRDSALSLSCHYGRLLIEIEIESFIRAWIEWKIENCSVPAADSIVQRGVVEL